MIFELDGELGNARRNVCSLIAADIEAGERTLVSLRFWALRIRVSISPRGSLMDI
jgi:hypothetical protein